MFRRFGSQVTIMQRGNAIAGPRGSPMSPRKSHDSDGGWHRRPAEYARRHASQKPARRYPCTVQDSRRRARTLEGSHLLVAAGRVPNTEALNLAAAGVATDDRGFIQVNERLETNVAGHLRAGRCQGRPAFTHISYDDFRICARISWTSATPRTDGRLVPYTVFIDPQLGRVGLTE